MDENKNSGYSIMAVVASIAWCCRIELRYPAGVRLCSGTTAINMYIGYISYLSRTKF